MRDGFVVAVMRYADDLVVNAEAKRIHTAVRKNAAKGLAAIKRKKKSKSETARHLDKDMRKTVKKKYLRLRRIAVEMGISEKTVERYLKPKK